MLYRAQFSVTQPFNAQYPPNAHTPTAAAMITRILSQGKVVHALTVPTIQHFQEARVIFLHRITRISNRV